MSDAVRAPDGRVQTYSERAIKCINVKNEHIFQKIFAASYSVRLNKGKKKIVYETFY